MPVLTFNWKAKSAGIPFYSPNPAATMPIGFFGGGSITLQSPTLTPLMPISFAGETVNVFDSNFGTVMPISFAGETVNVFDSNFGTVMPISFAGSV